MRKNMSFHSRTITKDESVDICEFAAIGVGILLAMLLWEIEPTTARSRPCRIFNQRFLSRRLIN